MSNRLSFAHVVPRFEAHQFLAAPATQSRGVLAGAMGWLGRHLVAASAMALTPALRRDMGLPAVASGCILDAERSRLGF